MKYSFLKFIKSFRPYLFIFSIVPFILLNTISITYAEKFREINTLDLPSYLNLLYTGAELPIIVKDLGIIFIFLIYLFFTIWYILFVFLAYHKLTNQTREWFGLVFEICLLSFVYLYFLSPNRLLYYLVGVLGLIVLLSIVIIFWYYYKKTSKT